MMLAYCPFRACIRRGHLAQGDALGYGMLPLQGVQNDMRHAWASRRKPGREEPVHGCHEENRTKDRQRAWTPRRIPAQG